MNQHPPLVLTSLLDKSRISFDQPCVLAPDRTALSYSGLASLIDYGSGRLREAGVGRSDVIAVALPNGPVMASAFLVAACTAVCAPLNPQLTASDHTSYLADLRAKAVLTGAGMDSVEAAAAALGIPILRLTTEKDRPAGTFTISIPPGCETASDELASPQDIALILPTSGTTAKPKLVPLTHRNLCASARNIAATLALEQSDRSLNMMPLFHIHGLIGSLLSTVYSGGSIVCTPGFSSRDFPGLLEAFQPTWYSAVPTIHQSVLTCAAGAGRSMPVRLRFIRSSSASLPPSVMAELEKVFEAPVLEAYGMTEASHQMASNPLPPRTRKPGSVGLMAGPEIAVVDESGEPVAEGAVGEIVIRGENVTPGYLRNEKATAEAFRDGWFRTGDQARSDDDGYLFLTGRTKELINRGGEKIAPREIEEALLEHPAIAQAVSFAVPHPTLGEQPAAAVVLIQNAQASVAELRLFAANRLPSFKAPRVIRIVPEIPKGPTGKQQRIGMAERLGIGGPDDTADDEKFSPPEGPLEKRIAELWCEALNVKQISALDDFFAAGGDSLLAVELLTRVSIEEDIDLPQVSLYENPTLRSFAASVAQEIERAASSLSSGKVAQTARTVVPIRLRGNRPPLFCVAGHESNFGIFCRLAHHLGPDQPIYGFGLPRLGTDVSHYRIDKLADEFVDRMRGIQPQGPYHLAGYCLGGFLVFEMARKLAARGEPVRLVCMIDTYLNTTHARPALQNEQDAGSLAQRLQFRVRNHAAALRSRSGSERSVWIRERIAAVSRKAVFPIESFCYGFCIEHELRLPDALRRPDLASRFATATFRPGMYAGETLLVRGVDHRSDANLMGWAPWLPSRTELLRVPVSVNSGIGTSEGVAMFAGRMAEYMQRTGAEAVGHS